MAQADKTALNEAIATAEALGIDSATQDLEDKAVVDALAEANAVTANPNATQAMVDSAKDKLNLALETKAKIDAADANASARARLEEAIANAKTKLADGTDWTPKTIDALQAQIEAGEKILADSAAETTALNDQAYAIVAATNELLAQADKTELQISVTKAQDMKLDSATQDPEDKAVVEALKAAEDIINNPDATQLEVDNAKAKLDIAMRAKLAADAGDANDKARARLEEAIAEAETKIASGVWTPKTLDVLQKELADAKQLLLASPKATTDALNSKTTTVTTATVELLAQANKKALEDLIKQAESLEIDPKTNSPEDKAVLEALQEAQEVSANANATQLEVDNAQAKLEQALAQKKATDEAAANLAARAALQKAIDDAKHKLNDGSKWTAETITQLEDAIKKGEALLADPKAATVAMRQQAETIADKEAALQVSVMPATKLTDAKTNVSVDIPEGAFACLVELHVDVVKRETKDKLTDAYDIYFTCKESGKRIQPVKELKVTLPFITVNTNNLALYHEEVAGSRTAVAFINSQTALSFNASDFSVYIMTSDTQTSESTSTKATVKPTAKPTVKKAVPRTGELADSTGVAVAFMLLALAATLVVYRKRTKKKQASITGLAFEEKSPLGVS